MINRPIPLGMVVSAASTVLSGVAAVLAIPGGDLTMIGVLCLGCGFALGHFVFQFKLENWIDEWEEMEKQERVEEENSDSVDPL